MSSSAAEVDTAAPGKVGTEDVYTKPRSELRDAAEEEPLHQLLQREVVHAHNLPAVGLRSHHFRMTILKISEFR